MPVRFAAAASFLRSLQIGKWALLSEKIVLDQRECAN